MTSKVLIIRFSSLGDLVLTTPVIENLKKSLPNLEIGLVTKGTYAELFNGDSRINKIFLLSTNTNIWNLAALIRSWSPDLIIDLHTNLRSYLLSLLIPTAKTIRYDNKRAERLSRVKKKKSRLQKQHTVEKYLQTLKKLNVDIRTKQPVISSEIFDQNITTQFISNHTEIKIGINPGALYFTKRWPHYHELILRLLADTTAKIILFGHSEDSRYLPSVPSTKRLVNTMGLLNLRQLATLIAQCDIFVTNDTGPMHMATAVGTKVLALFGSTTLELGFWPLGDQHEIIEIDLPCRPCHLHGRERCPEGHFRCMQDITVDAVMERIADILKI